MTPTDDLFRVLGVTAVTVEMRGGAETWSPLLSDEPWDVFLAGLTARYGKALQEPQRTLGIAAPPDEPGASAFDY